MLLLLVFILLSPINVLTVENLAERPFAQIVAPTHFACIARNEPVLPSVELVLPDSIDASAFVLRGSELCFEIHSGHNTVNNSPSTSGPGSSLVSRARCVPVTSSTPTFQNLAPGCHVLVVWWRSAGDTIAGSAHSVLFRVADGEKGGGCWDSCTAQYAKVSSAVTGGCSTSSGTPSWDSQQPSGLVASGDASCCTEGCCEFVNIASRCSIFSDGLPSCAACMTHTAPPVTTALAETLHSIGSSSGGSGASAALSTFLSRKEPLTASTPQTELLFNPTSAYLELFKSVVLNRIANPSPEKIDGHQWPANDSPALSMVGQRRLDHVHALLDDVVLRGVPGDFAECGCWKGGVAAFAAAVFRSADQLLGSSSSSNKQISFSADGTEGVKAAAIRRFRSTRAVWFFDSFAGLPPPNLEQYPDDSAHVAEVEFSNDEVLVGNGLEQVELTLRHLGVYDDEGTRLVKGFFNETLPATLRAGHFSWRRRGKSEEGEREPVMDADVGRSVPLVPRWERTQRSLAILRVDGDLYESTIQALHFLYPGLSVGGHVIVDDFTDWVGCRRAVRDFRRVHGLSGDTGEPLQVVWHDVLRGEQVRGVWWTKTQPAPYDPLNPALQPHHYAQLASVALKFQAHAMESFRQAGEL